MKIPNSSRIHIENDSVSSNFDLSDKKQNYLFGGNINNKTEQIRLKRNLYNQNTLLKMMIRLNQFMIRVKTL